MARVGVPVLSRTTESLFLENSHSETLHRDMVSVRFVN